MSIAPPRQRVKTPRPRTEARSLQPPPPASNGRLRRPPPRRNLQASVGDAAGYSVMVGIGETYFAAFALALGTGETFAGLLATLPMLCGATLQLLAPLAVRWIGSHRRWAIVGVSLQAVSLLLMPLAAWLTGMAASAWIFVAITMYWAAGLSTGPSWNTWIEEVIPRAVRPRYFARRARISQFCVLGGFVAGGLALQWGKASDAVLSVFCGVLLIAAVCRFASACFLMLQSEGDPLPTTPPRLINWKQAFAGAGDAKHFLGYLLAVQVAVQISGPYFTPYLISEEGTSYFGFMLLFGIAFIGKAISSPLWGRVAQRYGARTLLWLGGTAIVPIAGMWIFSDLFDDWNLVLPLGSSVLKINGEHIFLGCVQLTSGIAWGGYELAMLLMFFEAVPRSQRPAMLTIYNFGNAVATVIGGLIGATLLQLLGEGHVAYLAIFGTSSLARICTLPLLWRSPEQPAADVVTTTSDLALEARVPVGPPNIRIDPPATQSAPHQTRAA